VNRAPYGPDRDLSGRVRHERRSITAGQKAMGRAILSPADGGKGGRGKKSENSMRSETDNSVVSFSREFLRKARIVLRETPELALKARDGFPLNEALRLARKRVSRSAADRRIIGGMNFGRLAIESPQRCSICGGPFADGDTVYAGTVGDRGAAGVVDDCCVAKLALIFAIDTRGDRREESASAGDQHARPRP
jgi:hypothetical protein